MGQDVNNYCIWQASTFCLVSVSTGLVNSYHYSHKGKCMCANLYSFQGLTLIINQGVCSLSGNLLNVCMESCVIVLHPFQKISQECSHLQHDQMSLHCLLSSVSHNNARSLHSSCIVCRSKSAKLCNISWDLSHTCCTPLSTLRREMQHWAIASGIIKKYWGKNHKPPCN